MVARHDMLIKPLKNTLIAPKATTTRLKKTDSVGWNTKMNTSSTNRTIWQHIIALLRYFSKPKRFNSKFLILNLALATTLVVALHYAEDFVFFKEIKDTSLDWLMYWHSDFEPKLANGQPMQRMALFEIDDQTYREWGSPVITPRDKLKALIEAAEKGGANVIAVDIGLSWAQDGCIHQADKTPACPTASPEAKAADESLAKYLQAINESQAANTPLIILTRTYRHPLENGVVNQKHFLTKIA